MSNTTLPGAAGLVPPSPPGAAAAPPSRNPPGPPPAETVTDSLGRKLRVQRLDVLKELDLIELAGAAADNRRWMMMATLACTVDAINDVPAPWPREMKQLRAHIQLVGSQGIAAVADMLRAEADSVEAKALAAAGGDAPTAELATAGN